MGWADLGASSYTVPLSETGDFPATHWGLHIVSPSNAFLSLLSTGEDGHIPENIEDFSEDEFIEIMVNLIIRSNGFQNTLLDNNLKVILED